MTMSTLICNYHRNIDHSDADLQPALANIRMDMNGMRDNFEDAVSHMLPVDPYTKNKKHSGKTVQIADAHALQNKSNSKTGVALA